MKSYKWVLSKPAKGILDRSFFRLEEEDISTDLKDEEGTVAACGAGTALPFWIATHNIQKKFQVILYKIGTKKGDKILVEAVYCSVDPYMRPSAERMLSEGSTMVGEQVARVVCSKNSAYKTGEFVLANIGWRTVTIITNTKSIRKMPVLGDVPVTESLGIMGLTGLTAYYGLLEICQPTEGDVVVVTAAAGAVGSVVGQIAKIRGCKVIGICGREEKCRWITEDLGMDIAINYNTDDVDAKLKLAAPDGINCFFDNVGGDLSSVILHRMKLRGRVALCGTISLYHEPIDLPTTGKQPYRAILFNQLRVEGFNVLRWFQSWSQGHADLLLWIQEGRLKGRQTLYNGFDKMPEAFLGLFSGTNIGKTLVKI